MPSKWPPRIYCEVILASIHLYQQGSRALTEAYYTVTQSQCRSTVQALSVGGVVPMPKARHSRGVIEAAFGQSRKARRACAIIGTWRTCASARHRPDIRGEPELRLDDSDSSCGRTSRASGSRAASTQQNSRRGNTVGIAASCKRNMAASIPDDRSVFASVVDPKPAP